MPPLRKRKAGEQYSKKITLLIVGEGKTERNYFQSLKQEAEVRRKYTITVRDAGGWDQVSIVREAITLIKQARQRGEAYDEVWCVLDVEEPEKRKTLEEAMVMAQKHKITLCLSNPAFEIWLLAHFERRARPYNDCDAVIVELDRHWTRHFQQAYKKEDERNYDLVKSQTVVAIENARWVLERHHSQTSSKDANSSTEVYRLVERLLGTPS